MTVAGLVNSQPSEHRRSRAKANSSMQFNRGLTVFDKHEFTPLALVQRIVKTYLAGQWKLLLVVFVAMLFATATTGALPFLLQQVTDKVFVAKQAEFLYILPFLIIAVMTLRAGAEFIMRITQAKISYKLIGDLRKDMFSSLTKADLNYLDSMHSGRFVSVFTADVGLVNSAAAGTLISLIKNSLTVIFLVGAMFVLDWFLSLLVLSGTPLAFYLMARQRKKIRTSVRGRLRKTGGLSALLVQSIRNIRIVKAYNQEGQEQSRFNKTIDQIIKLLMRQTRAQSIMGPMTEALTGIGLAAAIFYGGRQGITGTLSLGDFTGFIAAAMLTYQPLKALAALQGQLTQGTEAAGRVFALIDHKPHIKEIAAAPPLKITKGEITFEMVDFSYDAIRPALKNFSLTIPAGQKVALVGPSGSGKTTAMNLAMRLFDPTKGRILVDGQDIKTCRLSSVRAAFALLTQEPVLFDETVADNIAYGAGNVTQEKIEGAAKAADAHDFIVRLSKGYETQVGEAGMLLSGGQKQRIAIARAILRDSPILLLDEPTSALDSESEARIQTALNKLTQGRTVLIIAHRLSTVQNADLICVLDHGHLLEAGTHEALLAKNGLYARFCRTQFNTEAPASSKNKLLKQPAQ